MKIILHTSRLNQPFWDALNQRLTELGAGELVMLLDSTGETITDGTAPVCTLYDGSAFSIAQLTEKIKTHDIAYGPRILLTRKSHARSSWQGNLIALDGILATSHQAAEPMRGESLFPIAVTQALNFGRPSGTATPTDAKLFIEALDRLLYLIRQWEAVTPLCEVVARELEFLGIPPQSKIIETVSKTLDALLPC